MRHQKLKYLDEFTGSMEEIRKKTLESYTIKERLAGLKPEEVLSRFKPNERLAGLKPNERVAGLKPEEMFAALSKTQRERLKKLLEEKS